MKEISSWPKIVNILDEKIRDIFGKEVIITEKIDGSQFGFGQIDNQPYCRSKNVVLNYEEKPDGMFTDAIEITSSFNLDMFLWVKSFVLYGEYLNKPKHNVLCYDKIPKNHLVLFGGIMDTIWRTKYMERRTLEYFASELGVDIVPILYQGILENIEMLDKLLDTESYLGGPKIEGLVIECRDYVPERMPWMPFAIAKYVSEVFREKHNKNWKDDKKSLDFVLEKCYVSEARFEKAYQHLRDAELIENSVTDIGALIKEVQLDFVAEEADEIKIMIMDFYLKKHMKKLIKQVSQGVPDWYKAKLKEMINDNSSVL